MLFAGVMHLTHQAHDVELAGQAGGSGVIEVTPEMIDAGLNELVLYEPGWDCGSDVVREIYTAMERARLRAAAARPSSVDVSL
jgi:hypothetical protein